MRRTCSIAAVTVAIISIIVFSVIPHHHHNDVVCFIMELCEHDNSLNDEHTAHKPAESHKGKCSVSSGLTSTAAYRNQPSFHEDGSVIPFFPLFCLTATLTDCGAAVCISEITHEEHSASRLLTRQVSCRGLRAPPCLLS